MSAEFERLVAEFERFQSKMKKVDDQLANVGRMQSEIAAIEASASNSDRSVTVVAGPGGAIKDIQLTDRALAQQPQALASELMSTIQQAVAEAARQQAGIVDEHVAGLGVTDQVLETQAQLFGTSPEALRERMEQQRPTRQPSPPPEEEYHEDYSQQDFLDADSAPQAPTPPPSSSGGSAGDEFLRNLFGEEGH
ncbi:YbaB/EbfC family nucleoid-associated protein [Saccharomonospora glauca]|uniref:YbaB/EbfC family nucleoid-associated protein n=1 Tax=Saccharomonospora glauca TaxID=40990 RepID=UPI00030FEB95|nr:YbaB/EbfC family nucleoid-associated protein [Saccharomonospora glauca]